MYLDHKMGKADYSNERPLPTFSESTQDFSKETSVTDDPSISKDVTRDTASFGHRDDFYKNYDASTKGMRSSNTAHPSEPYKRGALWHSLRTNVPSGFQTTFSFRISDQTRSCTLVKDTSFGTKSYESCRVHGADGFAFVLHAHANGTETLGEGGSAMGFGGISNAIAFKFDTWFNPEDEDLVEDHLVIVTNGKGQYLRAKKRGCMHLKL